MIKRSWYHQILKSKRQRVSDRIFSGFHVFCLFNLLDYRLFDLKLAPKDAKLVVCDGKCFFFSQPLCKLEVSEINKLVRNMTKVIRPLRL